MKKTIKTLCAAAALTCCMAFPAFAAETKTEYREAAAPIRSELKALEDEMQPLRAENKTTAAKYKSVRLEKKTAGTRSVSKENWKKAKELHKEITEIKKGRKDASVKAIKAEAKAAVKAKDYDTAILHLNEALELKESRIDSLKEINSLWEQIDSLIS